MASEEDARKEAQAQAQARLNELYHDQEVTFATVRRAIDYARGLQEPHRIIPLLDARENHLRESWAEVVATDKLIRSLAQILEQSHRSYFKTKRFEGLEVEFISALDQLSIWKYEVQRQAQQATTDQAPAAVGVAAANTHLKLPRLSIPQFSGKVTEWVPFRDSFIALVKSNASLSDVEKLHHLKASAKGEASEIICSVQLANGNFDTAWTLLESRYENKRVAVNAHLAEIFKLEPVQRESAQCLLNLRNVVKRNLAALKNLKCPTEHYGAILVHVLTEKLDQQTQRDWELSIAANNDIPDFDDLDTFLLERIRVLDTLSPAELLKKTSQLNSKASAQSQAKSYNSKNKPLAITSYVVTPPKTSCVICTQEHKIYQCPKFKEIPVTERYDYVRSLKLCSNCLGKGHKRYACPSTGSCRQCAQKHHTMLHRDSPRGDTSNASTPHSQELAKSDNKQSFATHLSIQNPLSSTKILLATAKIWVSSDKNRKIQVRALLDQGSTWSFVSSKLAAALGAQRTQVSVSMTGLGGAPTGTTSSAIDIKLFNQNQQDVCCTQALVLPKITSYSTDCAVPINRWSHIKNLQLADDLNNTGQIDLLIGADLYGFILLNDVRKGEVHEPVAQRTVFGWVVFGPCSSTKQDAPKQIPVHHSISTHNLDAALQKFWEVESIPSQKIMSPEDQYCESYFSDTHSRDADGRYIVRIPFKLNKITELGQSRFIAENLLTKIETRLARHPEQKILYDEFMLEYQSMNHMTPVNSSLLTQRPIVYLPHHPIIRNESQTTKLRVVFNASCKTSTSISLNDCMLTGPKLQSELFVILSQWRSYPLVFVADIAKMYRQILIDSRDRDFQRIIWRQSTDCAPTDYQLNTVTYGTRSAPYLALRVIKQLIIDEGTHFPLASTVLTHDTFVDDLLFGAYDKQSAFAVRNEVIALLDKAQLQPRKWASNQPELVSDIDPSNHGLSWSSLSHESSGVKVLGLKWHPATDSFSFSINLNLSSSLSKRQVLSLLSQLFDPLGWVSPVIVKGKILMQKLWLSQLQWDDILPAPLSQRWLEYFESLELLSQIQIHRWNNLHSNNQSSELHGFSDASNDAYGAAVYLRTVNESGRVQTALIMSKTKVSPLKQVSVHRLELQAALLLAQLIAALRGVRAFAELPVQCWTDSSITLSWLRKHSSTWKLFVSNRVAEIHELLPNHQWRHVPTLSNPADLASRGCAPSDLVNCSLWWHGAEWLSKEPEEWPNTFPEPPPDDALEAKIVVSHVTHDSNTPLYILVHKFSSWMRAVRVTAYVLRYKRNLTTKVKQRTPNAVCPESIDLGPLSARELFDAKITLFKYLQARMFNTELKDLSQMQRVSSQSKLSSLHPFLDKETGLIRVGGRLSHSSLSQDTKHPVILQSHPLVTALIRHVHLRCLHGGMKLTLSTLRQSVWILNPRPQIKSVLFKCLTCAKIRATLASQLMADLPASRVSRTDRAFVHCGIDYAGPLKVRMTGGRGIKSQQCYIAIFVCLSVKAIHLELVSDYSSPAFIAAYKRFTARRGLPAHMHSDRGTTFQGAERLLHEEHAKALSGSEFQACLARDNVTWHFIPPTAPHFGGIWEAGVKSVKTHLKRVLLDQTSTYEEMTTLLCQIEAVLNSRPLEPLNDQIDDLDPLTPGHFLTGGPLNLIPQCSLLELNPNRLSRWTRLQQTLELFWTRWSNDYLLSLQHRTKWRLPEVELKHGHMVLLRQPNMPPAKWNLARIVDIFPGSDGHVRVVKVKTARSEYMRPISELVLLPIDL